MTEEEYEIWWAKKQEEMELSFLQDLKENEAKKPRKWILGTFAFYDDSHERKYNSLGQKCPYCNCLWRNDHADYSWKFCPNCGKDMRTEFALASE